MILSRLDPMYRALFLIYAKKDITISELRGFFPKKKDIIQSLNYLVLDHTLKKTSKGFEIDKYEKSNFLKIVKYLFEDMDIPKSRTQLNSILKSKESSTILKQLLQSNIVFEYKTDTSNKEYLLPITKKDEMIKKIDMFELECMECAEDFNIQSRYIMVDMGEDIRKRNGERVNCYDIDLTKDECTIIVNLYDDMVIRKVRKIGKTMSQISRFYFDGDDTITCKTIHSLIKKGIVRCSMQNYYYLNESIISSLSHFHTLHKLLIKREKGEI